jgi:hypothetical protein
MRSTSHREGVAAAPSNPPASTDASLHFPLIRRLSALRLLRNGALGLLLLLGLAVLVWQVITVSQSMSDFCQDYFAGRYVLQGLSPYLPVHCWAGYTRIPAPTEYDAHPPFSVLLVLPLSLLPRLSATLLWGFVCLASYLVAGWLLLKELGWHSLAKVTLFVLASALWPPLRLAEDMQNSAQLLLLLLVAAWVLERRGHASWAGVLIGLAGLLKVWPAALLLGALLLRRWPLARSGALTLLAGSVLALLALGPATTLAYLGTVQTNEHYWVPSDVNLSLVGVVARPLAGYHEVAYVIPPLVQGFTLAQAIMLGEIVALAFLAGTLAFLWWRAPRVQSETVTLLAQGLLLTMILLAFPATWYWGMITLLLPCATTILALRRLSKPPAWWWLLLEASLMLPFGGSWLIIQFTGGLLQGPLATSHLGVATLLFDVPTAGVLLFASLQAWLLLWASRPHLAQMDAVAESQRAPKKAITASDG